MQLGYVRSCKEGGPIRANMNGGRHSHPTPTLKMTAAMFFQIAGIHIYYTNTGTDKMK
jgi:hypothetical protein